MEYKISEDVLKSVLGYLASRPYIEVAKLVEVLQSSEKIEEKKSKK